MDWSVCVLILLPFCDPELGFERPPHFVKFQLRILGRRPDMALDRLICHSQAIIGTLTEFVADRELNTFCKIAVALQSLYERPTLMILRDLFKPSGHLRWGPRGRRALTHQTEPAPRARRAGPHWRARSGAKMARPRPRWGGRRRHGDPWPRREEASRGHGKDLASPGSLPRPMATLRSQNAEQLQENGWLCRNCMHPGR